MVEYGVRKLIEAFLFLLMGGIAGIAYLRYLFKEEAQKVVYLHPVVDSSWNRGNTTPLMLDEEAITSCENEDDEAELLDPEIRNVVYSKSELSVQ